MLGSNEFYLATNTTMAYSQTKKISYNEKKLTQLKQQLYGKDLPTAVVLPTAMGQTKITSTIATPHYLMRDLWKIAFFASVAIISQLSLWYAITHSWVKIY